jgi:Secretion system C-terminal sorting domain
MKKELFLLVCLMGFLSIGCHKMTHKSSLTNQNNEVEDAEHAGNPGYFKQWFEKHKNADGIIPDGLPLKWYDHDLAKFALPQAESESAIVSVEQLGATSPQGGRTRALIIDQRNENVILAGAVSGGLWRSTDAGATWKALNDAASSLSVTAICQNPRKPTDFYYGTGETRGASQNISGAGIFKSTDGGLTFSVLPSTIGTTTVGTDMRFCNYIAHSLSHDSTIFVGTTSGLYRSVNGGSSWEKVLTGSNTGIVCYPDGRVLATVQAGGIYLSPNGNTGTFTKIVDPTFPTAGTGRILIANCKSFPQVVYALFTFSGGGSSYTQEGNNGLFKSSDYGQTWEKRSDSLSAIINARIGTTYSAYTQILGVHPTDTNRIVIGALSTKRSIDGGKTFSSFSSGHSDNHVYANVSEGDNFLVGSDGGVWRVNWLNATTQTLGVGYTTFQFYAGNYGPTGKLAIGGLQDNGTRKHQNGSMVSVFGGDGAYSHISQQNENKAYYATQNGATYRTSTFTTGGGTTTITPTAAIAEGVDFINQFEMNLADDQQLYYRTSKALWRTTNSGATWTRLLNTGVNLTNIQAIGVENNANPTVYVGGANNFYRFDSAATFDPTVKDYVFLRNSVPTEVKADAWGTISFHPSLSSTLLVGLTTTSPNPRAWRINKANTAAPEWVSISGDLPANLPVYQVQAHPDKPDSVYFAATAFGLYCSVNGGKNWTKETRIPNVPIFEMKLRANDRSLFLFTHGRGMFYVTLKDYLTPIKEVREKIAVKIYPNPTTDFLNIESQTPLSITQIFDLKGREIWSENQNPTRINISSLSKGIYFARIFDENGRFTTVKFVKQ